MRERRGPDFLGIGAQKAATTWLWRNLAANPGVWLHPRVKEFHYFDDREELLAQTMRGRLRGRSRADVRWRRRVRDRMARPSFGGLAWDRRFFFGRPSDEWYLSLFDVAGDRIAGDMTPDYLALPRRDIELAARLLPEARLILMVRHPLERLWSAAAFFRGKEGRRTWQEMPRETVLRFLDAPVNRRLTDYGGALRRWGEHYDARRIFVGFTIDVQLHPRALLGAVSEFLGVDPVFDETLLGERINWTANRTMPGWAASHLARTTADDIDAFDVIIGGHAGWWRHSARALAGMRDDETVEYPLTDGPLWEKWVAGGGSAAYSSGTLASIG